ncbi:hypothetical protein Acr_21g0010510 [Actinidia rufa]|uniref:Uncharacterized protein n=1 Tax=Actinidia rufa TaxID=165716 RepID=A0A7J0GI83_9ERIC|nr:hypothetical protein Acr_21g0010510 [Actinidia rufa]
MEPIASLIDNLKGLAKSTQDFATGIFPWRRDYRRRNPVATRCMMGLYKPSRDLIFRLKILKRLQREAFSDLMKLRDRQDKVERVLSFYKSSKGSPFQEASTHVRGEVDMLGALLMMDNADQQNCDTIRRAGIRTGVHSSCDSSGAHCRDVGIATNSHHEKRALTNYSSLGPPLLNQHNGSAIGLMVRKSNVVASLAQFVSGLGMHPGSVGFMRCFSTFGQVVFELSRSTKLSLLGIHQVPKISSQKVSLGALSMPIGIFKRREIPETSSEASTPVIGTLTHENVSTGSIALTLESELDESTRIGGWLEMNSSNPKCLQWAVSMSDTPEDEFGWGLSLGGLIQGPTRWDNFQVETFLNFNFSKRFSLQPALVYVMDGSTQFPALMFRSSWSL